MLYKCDILNYKGCQTVPENCIVRLLKPFQLFHHCAVFQVLCCMTKSKTVAHNIADREVSTGIAFVDRNISDTVYATSLKVYVHVIPAHLMLKALNSLLYINNSHNFHQNPPNI